MNNTISPTTIPARALAWLTALACTCLLMAFVPLTATGAQGAEITLLHGIPGIDVDVFSDGDPLIEEMAFGDRQDLSSFAGLVLEDLEVRLAGTEDVQIRTTEFEVPANGNYTIVAHLDPAGTPSLSAFSNDVSSIDPGKGRITIRNVAGVGGIDVQLNGERIEGGLPNGQQSSGDLNPSFYEIEIFDTETGDNLIGPEPFELTEGRSLIIYAVGSPSDVASTLEQRIDLAVDTPPEPSPTAAATPTPDLAMLAETEDLPSPPAAVDTGIGPLTITRIDWTRTSVMLAIPLLLAAAALGLRRRSNPAR